MTMPIDFFSDKTLTHIKCECLAKRHKRSINWENQTVSTISPGIVQNDEIIARQIFSPIHVDKNKEITSYAFNDMFNRGLSVNRMDYIDSASLHAKGEEKAAYDRLTKPDRKYLGYAIANVGEIRNSTEMKIRWFVVYDTSSKNNVSHADICCIFQAKRGSAFQSRQRRLIQQAFSKIQRP